MRIGSTIDGRPAQTLSKYDLCVEVGGVAALEESEEKVCDAVNDVQNDRPIDGEDLPGAHQYAEEE